MREFKLLNGKGQEYNLNDTNSFMYDPKGLGFGSECEFSRVGKEFIPIKENPTQALPSAMITFSDYTFYDKFKAFCHVGDLILAYKQINTWIYLDVVISSLELSEIDKATKRIDCPIQFTALSHWYEKVIVYRSEEKGTGKIYPYTYPYTYKSKNRGAIDIENGNIPSSCRIHILGPCINPKFIINQYNKKVADGRIIAEILSGRKLVIDTNPKTMQIAEYTLDNEYLQDRYADSDFTTDRIVDIPAGQSRITFTHEGEGVINGFVEVRKLV